MLPRKKPLAAALALLALAMPLAGCIGAEDEPVTQDNVDTTADNTVDPEETVAPDGRGDLAAFKETNKTEASGTGSMVHEHDYWKGRETIDITWIDSGLIPFPLMPPGKPTGTAIADYDIPVDEADYLVYEGTSEVILTATKITTPAGTDHPAVTVNFDYLTAEDDPGEFHLGGALKLNQPFSIPIKPTQADMPHQEKSLWIFRIYSSEPTWFEFNITVTIKKGYDVVNWPPHPDLYADSPTRVLYNGPVTIENAGTIEANLYGTDANWQNPERIISWGTDRVDVEISNVAITVTNGAPVTPSYYLLEYHNATKPPLLGHGAQYGGRLQDEGSDGTVYRFSIPTDTQSYDTPYGQGSRWGFRFVPQFDQAADACVDNGFLQQILVGCQFFPYKLTYDIKITAYGHSISGEGIPDENA